MKARCRSTGEDYNLVTQDIKEFFDIRLLETFCSLRLRKDVSDVTEGQLIAEINALIGKVKNDDLPDIKSLFKRELVMDLKESDVDARILAYFQRFQEIVLEDGLEEVFSGDDGEREKCKRLMACLAPPVLKKGVKTTIRWTEKEGAKSIRKLYTLVYNKAMEHERHFQKNKRMRTMTEEKSTTSSKFTRSAGKAPVQNKKPAREDFQKKVVKQMAERRTDMKVDSKANKKPFQRKEPPSPCPKCQSMHWLSNCTKATDAEKIALRQKLRDAKQGRKSRMKRLKTCLPETSRTVTINGVLDLPCCPDTGSDYTVICQSHWELLREADSSVQQIELETPVQIETFGSHPVIARTQAKLHLLIHTAAGPVQPAEAVTCQIVDKDDDEFIVGNDLLGALGIDVNRQLEQLASHSETNTSGDPFELESDELPAKQGEKSTNEDVRVAVESLIDRAV